jgi:hypothetical protein
MKTSKAHQRFAESFQNRLTYQRVLDHPEEFLGPNWKDVLNFWLFLDTLSEEQWRIVEDRYWELDCSARCAAQNAAWDAKVAWDALDAAAWAAALSATPSSAAWAAGNATAELIGSHILLSQNKSLTFRPMFLNL